MDMHFHIPIHVHTHTCAHVLAYTRTHTHTHATQPQESAARQKLQIELNVRRLGSLLEFTEDHEVLARARLQALAQSRFEGIEAERKEALRTHQSNVQIRALMVTEARERKLFVESEVRSNAGVEKGS